MTTWPTDADEVTGELLLTLARFGCSSERGIRALQSAETILREMDELEQDFSSRKEPLLVMAISCG
jgi:hypothetical protein